MTKTLVIFPLYTSRHLCCPADRALDVQDIGYSLLFRVIITITIISLLVLGKYVSKISITVHEQKTPYSVNGNRVNLCITVWENPAGLKPGIPVPWVQRVNLPLYQHS